MSFILNAKSECIFLCKYVIKRSGRTFITWFPVFTPTAERTMAYARSKKQAVKMAIKLFLIFAWIGSITYGGATGMLPILQREIVNKRHWASDDELSDYYAIGQCTPGIIAVNISTFIGYKCAGLLGGTAATLGMAFPAVVIISLLAGAVDAYSELTWVNSAFAGIKVCVCVLILKAVIVLWKKAVIDKRTAALFFAALIGSLLLNVSPVWFVILAMILGTAIKAVEEAREV